MLINNKKIWIYWRNSDSSYSAANSKVLVEPPRKIGSSISSVSRMLANSEEQKVLMADIISISPTSPEWHKLLKAYWDSISEEIPESGRLLNIGFVYDITSIDTAEYVKSINANIKSEKDKLATDEDLKDFVESKILDIDKDFSKRIKLLDNIKNEREHNAALNEAYKIKYDSIIKVESEHYKFGRPIDNADYMLYRYCLVYRDVANEKDLATKSPNIRFYLHSEESIKRYKQQVVDFERNRMTSYLSVIQSVSKVENVLYAMGFGATIPSDDRDKYIMLDEKSKQNVSKFIAISNDKNLETLGLIEKYIKYGIIRRLDGSQVVVDASDPSVIIGNNVDEVVTWFKLDSNKGAISEYSSKYKNLPK